MLDFGLAHLAKAEVRAFGTLISDACDRSSRTPFAFESLMHYFLLRQFFSFVVCHDLLL